MRGSPKAYQQLKDVHALNNDTLYFVYVEDSDDGELYLGEKLIAGLENLSSLSDIEINNENLADKQILMYDIGSQKWVNGTVDEAINAIFIGATEHSSGVKGLVPAPMKGQTNLFLCSDGSWTEIKGSNTPQDIHIKNIEGLEGYLTEEHFSEVVNQKLNFITQIDTSTFSVVPQISVNRNNRVENVLTLTEVPATALSATLGNLSTLPVVTLSDGTQSNQLVHNIANIYNILEWKEI